MSKWDADYSNNILIVIKIVFIIFWTVLANLLFALIAKNIDVIFDERTSYNVKDVPLTNVVEFLGTLSTTQYEKLEDFFLNEPKIQKKLQIKCDKCGTVHNVVVQDVFDFFT